MYNVTVIEAGMIGICRYYLYLSLYLIGHFFSYSRDRNSVPMRHWEHFYEYLENIGNIDCILVYKAQLKDPRRSISCFKVANCVQINKFRIESKCFKAENIKT